MKIYNAEFTMKEHSMKKFYNEGSFNEGGPFRMKDRLMKRLSETCSMMARSMKNDLTRYLVV